MYNNDYIDLEFMFVRNEDVSQKPDKNPGWIILTKELANKN